jgi:hypothetical protein
MATFGDRRLPLAVVPGHTDLRPEFHPPREDAPVGSCPACAPGSAIRFAP